MTWHTVCVDLIGTYTVLAKVIHTDNKILTKELQLLCTPFIDQATGWFEIVEVPIIDQYSSRISQLFNEVSLSRNPRTHNVISNNGSEFKRDFIPFLKYFSVKLICNAIKNSQANAILKIIHQVVGSMLNIKDPPKATFDVVSLWSKILFLIAYAVQLSYNITIQATPGQLVFCCYMLLDINL